MGSPVSRHAQRAACPLLLSQVEIMGSWVLKDLAASEEARPGLLSVRPGSSWRLLALSCGCASTVLSSLFVLSIASVGHFGQLWASCSPFRYRAGPSALHRDAHAQ